jgi:hypothetical protein
VALSAEERDSASDGLGADLVGANGVRAVIVYKSIDGCGRIGRQE